MNSTTVKLRMHEGEAMLKLAGTYPTIKEVMEEQVQNALDSGATRIEIEYDLPGKMYYVRDNGDGVTKQLFDQALHSIGKGIKERHKLGRFGLGLISPLGKCSHFSFTSCPKTRTDSYIEWTLATEKIRSQSQSVGIPQRTRKDLVYESSKKKKVRGQKKKVWWRTEVCVKDVTQDRMISNVTVDGLEQGILTKYNNALSKKKVKVDIRFLQKDGTVASRTVRPGKFKGKRLPEVIIETADGGKTVFNLFTVSPSMRKKQTRINIQFGELNNDFRFSFANFSLSISRTGLLTPAAREALKSGVFEGEILSEKCTLTPSRKAFEKNDALLDFCIAIEQWLEEHGASYLDEQKKMQSEHRYQDLGLRSIATLEKMFNSEEASSLVDIMKEKFKSGTIGSGHVDKPGKLQDNPALTNRAGTDSKKGSKNDSATNTPTEPEAEIKGHAPISVQGPRGQRRRTVKCNSIGLQLAHVDLGDSGVDLWHLDTKNGILTFNITHPDWVLCDDRDTMICALQEHIVIQALTLESMPDETFRQQQRKFADEATRYFVQWLLNVTVKRKN